MQNILIESLAGDIVTFSTEKSEEVYAFAGTLLSYKTVKYDKETNKLTINTKEFPRFYAEMNSKCYVYNLKFKTSKLFKVLSIMEDVPLYNITKQDRFILIRCEPGSNPNQWTHVGYSAINGVIRKDYQGFVNVEFPLTEAYRIIAIISDIKSKQTKYKIDEASLTFASKQLADRESLDKIALSTDIEYPDVLRTITLRPFQKVGATFVERTGGRAIICDEMGLGKSAQALAYVKKNDLSAVIICPASLKINWTRYVRAYLETDCYVCSGEYPTAVDLEILKSKRFKYVIINYDILGNNIDSKSDDGKPVTVYPWALFLNLAEYDCIILDEFHKIKNVEAKRTKAALTLSAKSIVGLSGTPILNRPQEAWPILHLLDKETFPSFARFESQYGAKQGYVRNLTELQHLLKTKMIRRTKKDVMKELPPINRVNEFHELNSADKKRYDTVLRGIYESLSGSRYDVQNLLVQIMRLKQVCAQAKMDTTVELAEDLYESLSVDLNGTLDSPLFTESNYNKVIIFSQFVECVTYIKNNLGMDCVSFTGSDSNEYRMKMCDAFQNDPKIKYLVCTTQVAAEGLNLTKAGAVIFNDLMWTPAAHQQAEGRAYGRLNESHPISSYYVLVEKSIEEYIQALLAQKLMVIESVVDGTNSVRAGESVFGDVVDYLKGGM